MNAHGPSKLFECTQCYFQANHNNTLWQHTQSIHEGVRHGCDVCGHLALSRDNLKRHIKLNHEKQAALFECNLCDYKAKKPHRIKDHKQAKHEGLTFNCDKCDFKNSSKNYLKKHKRFKHEVKDFKTLRYWQFKSHKGNHNSIYHPCSESVYLAKKYWCPSIPHEKQAPKYCV